MGQHKTPESTAVIASIASLGTALGYHVRPEWEIPGTGPHPEQIDLALFIAKDAERPAFAVEVDSADVPASMSNAMKIFGKPTRDWVKPSFVFHVFLSVAEQGSRRRNAEGAFNTQNYRTYSFDAEKQSFLLDLIGHHRAIRSEIDLVKLALAIDDPIWDPVDRYAVLSQAAREVPLDQLAQLTLYTNYMREALSRAVANQSVTDLATGELSFAGRMFVWPLLFGLRAVMRPEEAANTFADLRKWQEDPEEIIFHPSWTCLGLSPDFDVAISELAPPIFCLVAMLFSCEPAAARTLCEQLLARATDGKLNNAWERYALLWCAIASVRVGSDDVGEKAIARINVLGGLPTSVLANVPPTVSPDDGEDGWESVLSSTPSSLVSVALLKEQLSHADIDEDDTPERLVAEVLIDNELMMSISHRVLSIRLP